MLLFSIILSRVVPDLQFDVDIGVDETRRGHHKRGSLLMSFLQKRQSERSCFEHLEINIKRNNTI